MDKKKGTWTVKIREIGTGAGQLRDAPQPTYSDGKGISLFTGLQIPGDYIKAKAQAGGMKSALYSIAFKTNKGLEFHPPEDVDIDALEEAEKELKRLRPSWEKANIIPIETIPIGDKTVEPMVRGITKWADMFSPRQLLCMGVLVEELQNLRKEIIKEEGAEQGAAVVHLLAFSLDKFANWNAILASWNAPYATARSVFDRHDYAFKSTYCEMAPCNAGVGFQWVVDNVLEAYGGLSKLSRSDNSHSIEISLGSATNLPQIHDKSITAVVVDPPYADNVQYSELADFFYVWLKRTQGYHRPEWFSTYLCEHDEEAVVNVSRFKDGGKTSEAKQKANIFYQEKMSEVFRECRRILRDDGVLTVMFTHKKQEAWESLFTSLIRAGFNVTATWPVKTESEHSLHQAKKNAAQSTVILVARKREEGSGIGYFDSTMKNQIRERARSTAERLQKEGLNPVDQLVGTFGPAMEVYSRYDEVRTDTGVPVSVDKAIDEASDAVSTWRVEQLSERGLDGIEPEGKFFFFAGMCWVLPNSGSTRRSSLATPLGWIWISLLLQDL